MTEFIDPFPKLPLMIDVGGMKYYMGNLKPVELAYRSRSEFKNTFGSDPRIEYILRKYMHPEIRSKRKLTFSNPSEKNELIKILELRAQQLKNSTEFSSSLLKNTVFQKSYLEVQKLIQDLKGVEFKGADDSSISLPDTIQCTKPKTIKDIPEDRLFELILELSWLLLHPDQVPKDVQCSWSTLIKQLDTLRLGDIMTMIRDEQEKKGIQSELKPLNYLTKINIAKTSKAPTIKNALIEAKNMAIELEDENAKKALQDRIKILLNLLEVKKYLNNSLPVDDSRMKIIDSNAASIISRKMITNPLRGGKVDALYKPLAIAMRPMYTYFKKVYDPMYSFIESSITSYTKQLSIPSLVTALHLCNNLTINRIKYPDRDIYGMYRIINIDNDIFQFIKHMIDSTHSYLHKLYTPEYKNNFIKDIFELPNVRLSTLIDKNSSILDFNKQLTIVPSIQFYIVQNNFKIPSEDDFLNPNKPYRTKDVLNELNSFFTSDNLYILFTKPETAKENIPINMFEIDFNKMDIERNKMIINDLPDNYFNKHKFDSIYLDDLITFEEYLHFNDAELALSIFIGFKELMPK